MGLAPARGEPISQAGLGRAFRAHDRCRRHLLVANRLGQRARLPGEDERRVHLVSRDGGDDDEAANHRGHARPLPKHEEHACGAQEGLEEKDQGNFR
eukprot:CAMPEP_0206006270 /NCGR_PEP_ID=MMETSP1464-20131121/5078_1 /ASSEMBLY_ACC=CAM_ASM_001124 /TAXON_ID=119497 /ORGANISM="Exanthemachrysis gayraliae, Strain RCC1523" /LENGTH=96 /DNA_ID=CAMNT_0053379737 /DNA_START=105 /DNA_END=392 /DNA_ORIENTATION=-